MNSLKIPPTESKQDSISKWTHRWAQDAGLESTYAVKTNSTNDLGKDYKFREPTLNPILFLTDHQTKGRGRNSNTWIDLKPGTQLLSSWVFKRDYFPQPILAPLVGLALFNSVRQTWPTLAVSLKAPNDLFLADKKVAGILIETITLGIQSQIVIGLGFNVLAHPKEMGSACHLTEFLNELQQETWVNFCDCFLKQLLNCVDLAQRPLLDNASCQDILKALNNFPHLSEPFVKVTPDGSLFTKSGRIHWSEL